MCKNAYSLPNANLTTVLRILDLTYKLEYICNFLKVAYDGSKKVRITEVVLN